MLPAPRGFTAATARLFLSKNYQLSLYTVRHVGRNIRTNVMAANALWTPTTFYGVIFHAAPKLVGKDVRNRPGYIQCVNRNRQKPFLAPVF